MQMITDCAMALRESVLVTVVFLFSAALLTVSAGNINTDQCTVGSGCLQCISSATPEVERCMQLRFLITLSVSLVRTL